MSTFDHLDIYAFAQKVANFSTTYLGNGKSQRKTLLMC